VLVAAALPPVLGRVAPGFLDPYSCGSGNPKRRLTTTANEIEPIR